MACSIVASCKPPDPTELRCSVVGARTLCIQAGYFQLVGPGEDERLLIHAKYPGFAPLPSHQVLEGRPSEYRREALSIYLAPADSYHQNDQAVELRRASYFPAPAPDRNGLITTTGHGPVTSDLFYEPTADPASAQPHMIQCAHSAGGTASELSAVCRHTFVHDDLFIAVQFDRQWLPEWKRIKDGLVDLIEGEFSNQPK